MTTDQFDPHAVRKGAVSEDTDYLVVTLLEGDGQALDTDYPRIESI